MTIQWARIHRGRVWHMFWPGGPVLCNSELVPWETNIAMPPRGGVPCQPCEAAMKEAWEFAEAAVLAAQQAHDGVFDLDVDEPIPVPLADLVQGVRLTGSTGEKMEPVDDELVRAADEVVTILVSNAAATLDAEGSDD